QDKEIANLTEESEVYKKQIEYLIEGQNRVKDLAEKERELEVALEKLKDNKGGLANTDRANQSKTITQQQEKVRMMREQINQELVKAKKELAAANLFAENRRIEARAIRSSANRAVTAANTYADGKRIEASSIRSSANRAVTAANAYADGKRTEASGIRSSANRAVTAANTYADGKKIEASGIRSSANRVVTAANTYADGKRTEVSGIKSKADRELSTAKTKAQNIKRQTEKILKDIGTKFTEAQRAATAANAKKTNASGGQDGSVTTADAGYQELVEVQQKLDALEQEITTLTDTIGEKEQEITTLTDTIEEKEQEITTLTNTIEAKDQEIKELTNTHKEEKQKLTEQHDKVVKDMNKDSKDKAQEVKDKHDKVVEQLDKNFKAKEQALQKGLADLTKAHKTQGQELAISKQNLTNLTNSYKPSWQVMAQQKKDEKRLQELEKQITALKEGHKNELAKYQQENQSLKSQIALNETKQANDVALKQNMCELAQQGLAGTQQAMQKLKQLPLNLDPIDGDVANNGIKRYKRYSKRSLNSNDLPDPLNKKLAATKLLEQQSNETPVVIQKEFPTEVANPVKIVETEAQNVLRDQSGVVAYNTIKKSSSVNDLKSPDLSDNKPIETNISEKKQIKSEVVTPKNPTTKVVNSVQTVGVGRISGVKQDKTPVVIQKGESPAKVASPVKTVRTGASNVLIERGQNGPQLAASKRPTTKVIDPEIVKKDTAVTKPKIVIPAVTRIPNNATPPKILNSLPRQIGVQSPTKNIRD
ncbi:MAG: hypothetical protein ACEY3C_05205, partial [Candidatus Tisiphia sp.]